MNAFSLLTSSFCLTFFFFLVVFYLEQQYSDLEKRYLESQDQCQSVSKDHQKLQEEFTSLGKPFMTVS